MTAQLLAALHVPHAKQPAKVCYTLLVWVAKRIYNSIYEELSL